MRKTIQTIVLSILIISCSSSDFVETEISSIVDVPISTILKTSKIVSLKNWGIKRVSGLVKQGNNIIIANRNSVYHAININLESNLSTNMFPRGRGKNEAIFMTSFSETSDSEITAFDFSQGKLFLTPSSLCFRKSPALPTQIQLPLEKQNQAILLPLP